MAHRRARFPDLATFIALTGTTQTEIAEAVGVSQAAISRILHGYGPRPELAAILAEYAGVPLASFIESKLQRTAPGAPGGVDRRRKPACRDRRLARAAKARAAYRKRRRGGNGDGEAQP